MEGDLLDREYDFLVDQRISCFLHVSTAYQIVIA
jgi:hypothetical protein